MHSGHLADVVLVVHALLTACAALSVPLLALGVLLHASWARHLWFRLAHALYVIWVLGQWCLGLPCPLTRWEARLRLAHGDLALDGSFLARVLAPFVRPEDVSVATAVLLVLLGFGTLVLALAAPPRLSR